MHERPTTAAGWLDEIETLALEGLDAIATVLRVAATAARQHGQFPLLTMTGYERRAGELASRVQCDLVALLSAQIIPAPELRHAAALLHVSGRVDRMVQECADLDALARHSATGAVDDGVSRDVVEMRQLATLQVENARQAFAQRDIRLVEALKGRYAELDRRNCEVMRAGSVVDGLVQREELIRAVLTAEGLARVSAYAVDIGEQVEFLVTGCVRGADDLAPPVATGQGL